ncbi:MAG: pantoate--beta-alanine ligase [Acidimicrobiia bacterium]
MKRVATFAEVRQANRGSVGLVPTMGFLHEGHISLIEAAKKENDHVVVSVFVNPLQFGDPADLKRYPHDIDRDARIAAAAGADVLLVPSVEYMYPGESTTTVDVGKVGETMEGAHRPGHFTGVATVVAKLFAGVQPQTAYFGRKDAQQLAVVSQLAADLRFPVEVRPCPIVRESDGLALSSRNVRLGLDARSSAAALFAGLEAGADLFETGERSTAVVIDVVRTVASSGRGVDIEYVALADSVTAIGAAEFVGEQFLAIAATVGSVRLIDNITIDASGGIVDTGIRLGSRSILYGEM